MPDIVPGNWYFTTSCKSCGKMIIFGDAPAPQDVVGHVEATQISLTCPTCQHKDVYQPEEMQIVQAAYKQ